MNHQESMLIYSSLDYILCRLKDFYGYSFQVELSNFRPPVTSFFQEGRGTMVPCYFYPFLSLYFFSWLFLSFTFYFQTLNLSFGRQNCAVGLEHTVFPRHSLSVLIFCSWWPFLLSCLYKSSLILKILLCSRGSKNPLPVISAHRFPSIFLTLC